MVTLSPAGAPRSGEDARRLPTKAKGWQAFMSGSGLLLALTFVMPAIKDCSDQPVAPVGRWTEAVADHDFSFDNVCALFVVYGVAYAFGALLSCGSVARSTGHPLVARAFGRGILALLVVLTGTLAVCVLMPRHDEFTHGYAPDGPLWLLPALALGAVWLSAARRLGDFAYLVHALVGSVAAVSWFAYWIVVSDHPLYGLYLSLVGSVGTTVAAIGEAGAVTGASFVRAAADSRDLPRRPLCAPLSSRWSDAEVAAQVNPHNLARPRRVGGAEGPEPREVLLQLFLEALQIERRRRVELLDCRRARTAADS